MKQEDKAAILKLVMDGLTNRPPFDCIDLLGILEVAKATILEEAADQAKEREREKRKQQPSLIMDASAIHAVYEKSHERVYERECELVFRSIRLAAMGEETEVLVNIRHKHLVGKVADFYSKLGYKVNATNDGTDRLLIGWE